jgi:hypothetical protein
MLKNIGNVTMAVPVLMISCRVLLEAKTRPMINQTPTIAATR